MIVRRTGDWAAARRLLSALPATIKPAVDRAILQEAHAIRAQIVQGLVRQAPAGEPLKPLAELTLAARRLGRFSGTKALIRRGDLLGAISVLSSPRGVFVGVPRTARNRKGDQLADVAATQEYGTDPIIIPITARMRRFLAALFREAGRHLVTRGRGRGVVVVQVPPRPFLRPVFEQSKAGMSQRVLERAWRLLNQEPRR